MKGFRALAGIAAILQALINATAFYYFRAVWSFPHSGDAVAKMGYLYKNHVPLSVITFLVYVVLGCLLAILVTELRQRLKHVDAALASLAFVFGAICAGLLISSGMLSNAGLYHACDQFISTYKPDEPLRNWQTMSVIAEAIAGGSRLVGGIWVLLVSVCALQGEVFSKPLGYLGLLVGAAGVATVYPDEMFVELFRGSQTLWLLWLGMFLFSAKYRGAGTQSTTNTAAE